MIDRTSFLSGANATFIAELHGKYVTDPGSVGPSWARFFAELGDEAHAVIAELGGASWTLPDDDRFADGDVVGEDMLGLHLDPVTGQVQADVGTRDLAVALVAALGIDGHHVDLLGLDQERQGVVDGAGGQAAGVPGDHHPFADGRVAADERHDQDRPADRQDQPVRHVVGRRRVVAVRVALTDDRKVAVTGMQGQGIDHLPLGRAPLVGETGTLGRLSERLLRAGRALADRFGLGLEDVVGDLDPDEPGNIMIGDHVKAGQVGPMSHRQIDRRFEPDGALLGMVDANQNVLEGHVLFSLGPSAGIAHGLYEFARFR